MPYFVFKFENSELARLKELKLLSQFDTFSPASKFAKAQRATLAPEENMLIKISFADNVLAAEEQVRAKREPIPGDD